MSSSDGSEGAVRLTFLEAASIIAGYGIGGGILALPWFVSLNGILPSLVVLVAAYALSLALHLMIAELTAADGGRLQIIELFRKHLFKGKIGAGLTWFFFVVLGVVFLANLAAYVSGGGEVLASVGLPAPWGAIAFYVAAAAVAIFGLKVLGIAEKWSVIAMAVLFAGLVAFSAVKLASTGPAVPVQTPSPDATRILALYGMAMFCFAAFFSIPQAVKGLMDRPKLIGKVVAAGLGINFGIMLVVTTLSLLLSSEPTAIATVGWSKALGPIAEIIGAAFVILAMLTSFWSISMALSDIVRERLGLGRFPAWILATLPPLALSLAGLGGFMDFMRTAGGGIAVIVAVLLVPTYRRSRKGREGAIVLGNRLASPAWDWVVAIAYVAMAVGSLVSVG
ncbi:MAG: aromatic amino acid transport family protein [Rectinemataceae bacterium]